VQQRNTKKTFGVEAVRLKSFNVADHVFVTIT